MFLSKLSYTYEGKAVLQIKLQHSHLLQILLKYRQQTNVSIE